MPVTVRPKPGKSAELQRLLSAIRNFALSKLEPGCLSYRVVATPLGDGSDQVKEFVCIEEYEDEEAVQAHGIANPGVKDLVEALQAGEVFAEPPTILGPLKEV
ncbi:hypothetical protein Rhopal_004377-T1 [Rhodotorula paludigena]|uniref:ABM domain-containing protein n=1 Tax=Rhodotorula paludigena TaxID=86838 RepID=A0AAV5GFW1_9BASI|nr:hypothetical protein Rhopal_004377-T1 [Rhodotorula paludigena]